MPLITITATVNGAPIADLAADITAAINRELDFEFRQLAQQGLSYWRKRTPKISGRLRLSERVNYVAKTNRFTIQFRIIKPGSAYYHLVARHHPHLRKMQVVTKWLAANENAAIERAITRGLDSVP